MSEQKLLSANAIAVVLERGRQTITRATRNLAADGHDKAGHPRWKLSSVVAVLNQSGSSGSNPRMVELAGQLEQTGAEAMEGLARLRAIPDIAKRRKYADSGALRA